MKYSVTVDINLPLNQVVQKFKNTENYYDWMKGLEKIEQVKGAPGEKGAEQYLHFNMGKRKMKMLEKVVRNNLPDSYCVSYEVNGVYNEVDSHFESINEETTRYTTSNLFQFSGVMKIMSIFMKGAFKKQSIKYLQDFKKFVEQQN